MSNILNLSKTTAVLDLTKAAPGLKNIRGLLNWDPNPNQGYGGQDFDLDIFVFALTSAGKITSGSDVIFFNNKSAHGVSIPRDNRNGQGNDDEELFVDLEKVPTDKAILDIYVFIHDAAQRKQFFGMMANATFTLINKDTGSTIQEYKISSLTNETAIHIGALTRSSGGWAFEPSGEAGVMDPNQVAGGYL